MSRHRGLKGEVEEGMNEMDAEEGYDDDYDEGFFSFEC